MGYNARLALLPRVKTEITLACSINSQHMTPTFWPFHKPTAHRSCAVDPDSQEVQLSESSLLQRNNGDINYLKSLYSIGRFRISRRRHNHGLALEA